MHRHGLGSMPRFKPLRSSRASTPSIGSPMQLEFASTRKPRRAVATRSSVNSGTKNLVRLALKRDSFHVRIKPRRVERGDKFPTIQSPRLTNPITRRLVTSMATRSSTSATVGALSCNRKRSSFQPEPAATPNARRFVITIPSRPRLASKTTSSPISRRISARRPVSESKAKMPRPSLSTAITSMRSISSGKAEPGHALVRTEERGQSKGEARARVQKKADMTCLEVDRVCPRPQTRWNRPSGESPTGHFPSISQGAPEPPKWGI